MKIGFIGAGKVGCSIGKYLYDSELWELQGYYSKSIMSAKEAVEFTGGQVYEDLKRLAADSDAIFITTPDGSIADCWEMLRSSGGDLKGKIVVHCSGALSSYVFEGAESLQLTAVSLHPLYAISDKCESYRSLQNALFTLEGTGERLGEFREKLEKSGLTIQPLAAEHKITYHAAAATASNLMVALSEMAIELLLECGFDREHARMALRPLMSGNLAAVMDKDTEAALTGPAERADTVTIQKHLSVLSGENEEIYRLLSRKLVNIARRKNPDRDYDSLEELLKES